MSFSIERAAWVAGVALAIAYVVTLCLLTPLPLQDYPAHLENAIALDDLIFHGGARFGGMFSYQFLFVPYVLGDLGFAASVEVLGAQAGSAFWMSFVFLSLPLAILFFMRVAGIAADRRALIFILSLYLATDWFFLMGFLSFRLGLAVTIANLALAIRLRNAWSRSTCVGYWALVVVGYLVHLTTIALLTPAIAVSGLLRLWRRKSTFGTEALLMAPMMVLWIWHFWAMHLYTRPGDPIENPYIWGTPYDKLVGMGYEFIRYHLHWDLLMMGALVICLILSAAGTRLRELKAFAVLEMLLLAATFVAVYWILPQGYSEAWYVDVRSLALVSVCVVLAFAYLPTPRRWRRSPALVLAVGLAAVNLIYLQRHLARSEARLTQYRTVVAAIPPGANVLPVATRSGEGNIAPCRHIHAFITIDRGALMPYAFNADTANPEKYLRYVAKPYAPVENWYLKRAWSSVDWPRVVRDYDYLLVEKPFDSSHIPVQTWLVAESPSAALFGIQKPHPCRMCTAASAP